MNYIVNIDSKKFSVNGIPYYKNFVPHVIGDSLRIINQYDSSFELVGYSKYNQFTVNGQTFLNVATLQDALLPVLFSRNTLGSGTEPNTMLTVNEIERVDNDFTITAGETWRLNGVIYTGLSDFNFEIEPEELGFKRIDVIIATTTGYQKISGEPYTDIVSPPDIPDPNNVVIRKTYNIDGSDIDDSIPPITGDEFVKKSDFSEIILIGSGVLNMVSPASNGAIRFQGTNAVFQSIFVNDPDNLWNGKPFDIINSQANEQTLKNLTGPGLQLSFPDNQDYVMQPNERCPFRWRFTDANIWVLEYVGPYPNYTPQKTITVNTTLDNSYNGCIVKVKANATITVPTTLKKNFSCVFRTWQSVTATFAGGVGVTMDALGGSILEGGKIATLFKDGALPYYVLEGGLKL